MVYTYKRKTTVNSWSESDLIAAVNLVRNDGVKVLRAAKTFNIPESTLRKRLLQNNLKKRKAGPGHSFHTCARTRNSATCNEFGQNVLWYNTNRVTPAGV